MWAQLIGQDSKDDEMVNYTYHKAMSIEEVLSLLAQYGEDATVLAGGQSLVVLIRQGLVRPAHIVDIKNVAGIDYIAYDEKEGLKIGALATHRAVEKSPSVAQHYSALVEMEKNLAHVQVRNWGTLIGDICFAAPTSEPQIPLIALGAKAKIKSKDREREVALEEFCKGYYENTLRPGEILLEVSVPPVPRRMGVAYEKFAFRKADYALANVAVSVILDGGEIESGKVVLGAVSSTPIRVTEVEDALIGETTESINKRNEELANVCSKVCEPLPEPHASTWYKQELVGVLFKRVLDKAIERAR